MKKSLKQVLAVILSAVMLVSCFATAAFAQGGQLLSALSTIKTVADYGESLKTVGDQVKNLPQVPKKVLDVGVSAVKLEKAKGDLTSALIQNGLTDLTFLPQLTVSNIKLAKAVNDSKTDTASGSVKLVIALAQQPTAVLKDAVSVGKLNSAVTSGLATNLGSDIKLVSNGVKTAGSAKDLVTPSLSDLIEGIKFPIRGGTAVKNIVEIAKGDNDNAKPLVGTAQITDHNEEAATEETSLAAEEEETPAQTTAVKPAVAHTDGPMD